MANTPPRPSPDSAPLAVAGPQAPVAAPSHSPAASPIKKGIWSSVVEELLTYVGRPETHAMIETHILRPILHRIYQHMFPYIAGVLLLWILMFCCLAIILLLLVRGSLMDSVLDAIRLRK
jgi:hypothetical protein